MTKKWLRERKDDHYHKLAVEEGYRSRAAYKLFQIDQKYEILKSGDVVLDLGASPGGWMQAARVLVGEKGCVLGVDLKEIKSFKEPNVTSIMADAEKLEPADLAARLPRKINVLISDMSPNVSGVWSLDHIRQLDLARMALRLSTQLLNPGGNFVVKVFQGEFFKVFLDDVRNHFKIVRVVKPKATRSESAEMYLVCIGFRG
ncbi:RlmE family RNA methyltransferase [Candidatus Bathyarchaeota archaeon]|nr:RlmE family RNA methyltransferase [Candidatus Bathyarchaeota archaeon]